MDLTTFAFGSSLNIKSSSYACHGCHYCVSSLVALSLMISRLFAVSYYIWKPRTPSKITPGCPCPPPRIQLGILILLYMLLKISVRYFLLLSLWSAHPPFRTRKLLIHRQDIMSGYLKVLSNPNGVPCYSEIWGWFTEWGRPHTGRLRSHS